MKAYKRVAALAGGLVLVSAAATAGAALSAAKNARVAFQAAGPAGMKIEGVTSEIKIDDAGGSLLLDVPLSTLATGIALRDRHMKEKYLEVQKYPEATLLVARSALKLPASGARVEADAPATFTLHGQARPVTVHYEAAREGDGYSVSGRFHVKMDDFGIAIPSYLGVTVKPDVDVQAAFRVEGA